MPVTKSTVKSFKTYGYNATLELTTKIKLANATVAPKMRYFYAHIIIIYLTVLFVTGIYNF